MSDGLAVDRPYFLRQQLQDSDAGSNAADYNDQSGEPDANATVHDVLPAIDAGRMNWH